MEEDKVDSCCRSSLETITSVNWEYQFKMSILKCGRASIKDTPACCLIWIYATAQMKWYCFYNIFIDELVSVNSFKNHVFVRYFVK